MKFYGKTWPRSSPSFNKASRDRNIVAGVWASAGALPKSYCNSLRSLPFWTSTIWINASQHSASVLQVACVYFKGPEMSNYVSLNCTFCLVCPLYSFDVDVVCIVRRTVEWAGRVGWGAATVFEQRRTVHPVRATVKQPCQRGMTIPHQI